MASTSRNQVWQQSRGHNANKFRNLISDSWKRCEQSYGLTSNKAPSVDVLDEYSIKRLREQCVDLAAASERECRQLHAQTSRSASIVVLTDAKGVIVKTIGSPSSDAEFRKSFLVPGAIWSEESQGTNGMGTSLASDRLVTVHKSDHFFRQYDNLTCISAPIHDHRGCIIGALDVTTMQPRFDLDEQEYACNLVQAATNSIEHRYFKNKFRNATLIGFHPRSEMLGYGGEGLIALDNDGEILALNNRTMNLLKIAKREQILGKSVLDIFEAPENLMDCHSHDNRDCADGPAIFDRRFGRRFATKISLQSAAARKNRGHFLFPGIDNTGRAATGTACDALSFDEISGNDDAVRMICDRLKKVADKNINILISGETGSGKKEIARTVHRHSALATAPLITLNCAGLNQDQVYDELLSGYEANQPQGQFVCTILLDQVSDLSEETQNHLLHILQSNQLPSPEKGKPGISLQYRLICTDHLAISELSRAEILRPELYYRLNGLSVEIPPVRNRSDVAELIEYALRLECAGDSPPRMTDDALEALLGYSWPGNIREIRSVMRIALAMCDGSELGLEHLPDLQTHQYVESTTAGRAANPTGKDEALQSIKGLSPVQLVERETIIKTLDQTRWNLTRAASVLEMSRSTIYRKIRKYRIAVD